MKENNKEVKLDEVKKMSLYEKLLNITTEMGYVNKNLIVGEGKSTYKAVGEADVLKAVKELELKYRVYSYPKERQIIKDEVIEKEKVYNGTKNLTLQNYMRLEVTYIFINVDNPDEHIEIKSYGDGIDTQDKAPR